MFDILRRIVELRRTERPGEPVRARLGFGEIHTEQSGDEFLVAQSEAEASHRCGDLRVEQVCRAVRNDVDQRFQILACAVHDGDGVGGAQACAKFAVRAEFGRIQQRDVAFHVDLHQRQARTKRVRAHELGVHAEDVLARVRCEPCVEYGAIIDPLIHALLSCSVWELQGEQPMAKVRATTLQPFESSNAGYRNRPQADRTGRCGGHSAACYRAGVPILPCWRPHRAAFVGSDGTHCRAGCDAAVGAGAAAGCACRIGAGTREGADDCRAIRHRRLPFRSSRRRKKSPPC